MPNASLRCSEESLIVTSPASSAGQNGLVAGSSVAVELSGAELTLRAWHQRPSLDALLVQTPCGTQRAEKWDTMACAGREL